MASGAEEAQEQPQEDQPQSFRLRVANLDWNTTDENFSTTFEEFKPTEAVIIRRKKNSRSRGYGFVTFSSEADMNAALEKLNGTKLDNREISIQVSTSKGPYPEGSKKPAAEKVNEEEAEPPSAARLIVQRLGWTVDNDALKESFGKFGEVTSAKVIKNRKSGRSRGYGFVTFANAEDGQKALEALDGNQELGFTPKQEDGAEEEAVAQPIRVAIATTQKKTPREPKPRKTTRAKKPRRSDDNDETDGGDKPGPRRLFVRDLNEETTEETLEKHYGVYGTVKNVRVIKDRETEKSKGFAYITFEEHETFSAALEAFKSEAEGATQIDGADIKVVRALPSRAMRGRGGGGGGGRGRGRRRRPRQEASGGTGTDL